MNRCNAQILKDKGEYRLQFETDNIHNFRAVTKVVRACIDGKPRTNFGKITESVESLARTLSKHISFCEGCPAYKHSCKGDCEDCIEKIKIWLQQEIEDEEDK